MGELEGGESKLEAPPAVVARTSPSKLVNVLVNAGDGVIKLTQLSDDGNWLPWENVAGEYISGPAACWEAKNLNVFGRGTDGKLWRSYLKGSVIL
jgi:hypothetical protein